MKHSTQTDLTVWTKRPINSKAPTKYNTGIKTQQVSEQFHTQESPFALDWCWQRVVNGDGQSLSRWAEPLRRKHRSILWKEPKSEGGKTLPLVPEREGSKQ
jgi:hypothetical protein